MRTRVLVLLMSILVAGGSAFSATAGERPEIQKIHDAEEVLRLSTTAPDKGIPRRLLERAECIGVFPGLTKGAFVVGAEFGRGVFTCRQKNGTMGAPAFFTIGGGSFGWQFGGEQARTASSICFRIGSRSAARPRPWPDRWVAPPKRPPTHRLTPRSFPGRARGESSWARRSKER